MRPARREKFVWMPSDQAEYAKWRRGVFALYGRAGLIGIAAYWVHHLSNDGANQPVFAATAKARISPPDLGPGNPETSVATIYRIRH
jgi:hypothetical protein